MADVKHVTGKDKGKLLLYALSTCVWCKKIKTLLNNLGVAYDYVDVDQLSETEKEKVMEKMRRWNPRGSFPTLVVNDEKVICGFDETRIREIMG